MLMASPIKYEAKAVLRGWNRSYNLTQSHRQWCRMGLCVPCSRLQLYIFQQLCLRRKPSAMVASAGKVADVIASCPQWLWLQRKDGATY